LTLPKLISLHDKVQQHFYYLLVIISLNLKTVKGDAHLMNLKKVLIPVLSLSILTAVTPTSVFAFETSTNTQPITINQVDQQVEPQGVKSYLVKKAVKVIAYALRKGGDVLEYIVKWLDKDAAKALSKYSDKIANELDYIATIPDLAVNIVKEKIYYFMINELGLSGGIALQIADAIATAINWLVL
jgi:hypothetical protein